MYKKIINLTFLPVFENKTALIKALFIPLILIVVLTKMSLMYPTSTLVSFSTAVLMFLINITIAITTHRILLLGSQSIPKWGLFKFGSREFQFFVTSAIIAIIITVVVFIGSLPLSFLPKSLVASGVLVISVIFAVILFSRFSLALPSIAIDKQISISDAWEYTKHYKLLTFFTIIVFPLLFAFIIGVVYTLVIGFLVKVISVHLNILYPLLDVFIAVFIISALSATYRVIQEQHPEYFKQQSKENNELIIHNNKEQHRFNINEYEINFESLKQELIRQYEQLGFDKIVVDKEDSWMAKHPENETAYIALSLKDNEYKIEAYNTQQADLEVFLFNNAKNN